MYIPCTRAERISKTVVFFPHDFPVLSSSATSDATTATHAFAKTLLHPTPTPYVTLGDDKFTAIQTLSRILSKFIENPPTAVILKIPRLAPTGVLQTDCPAPSPRVPLLTPPALTPRVNMVPANLTHKNHPPKPVLITLVQCIWQLTPTPTLSIIKPDRDDPVLTPRYNLRPQPRPIPYNRRQGITQPRYEATLSHLVYQEEQANVLIDPTSGQALKYRHLICNPNGDTWIRVLANNLGRLAQGVGTCNPTGTNAVFFLAKPAIPQGRKVTYVQMVASIRPTKSELNRVCVTVGGDRLDFPRATTTHCAGLTTTKCLFKSTISTPGARFMTLDIKYF